MIGRHGKFLIALYGVFLVVLFLMCSTDLIIGETEREIYQVAVIVEDARSDNYSNFRKGMDQAAMEFNVDVRFITLYERMDAEQQMELMEREEQDGVDAVIVIPVDEEQVAAKQMTVPIVLLRSGMADGAEAGNLVLNYEKMGVQVAQEMCREMPQDSQILLFTDPVRKGTADRRFIEGASAAFEDAGYNMRTIPRDGENGFRVFLNTLKAQVQCETVILAENPDILTEVAGILSDDPALAGCIRGLYGRENTVTNLNYLDQGYISGLSVTDDYSAGYLSVRAAVQMLEGTASAPVEMESYYIRKENLRDPAYEKLLYPIE